jgi:hypothetical protein
MSPLHPAPLRPSGSNRQFSSLRGAALAAAAVAAIGAGAYEYYELGFYQPNVIARGETRYAGRNGARVKAATRQVSVGKGLFWQVELAPGVWKDCSGDCAGTLRRAMQD